MGFHSTGVAGRTDGAAAFQTSAPRAPFYLAEDIIAAENSGPAEPECALAEDLAALDALKDGWRALEREAARDIHAFQSFDWCRAWARTYMTDGRMTPFVVTIRQGGRLVLVWPMMKTRLGPVRVLSWLSDPFSQYGDVLTSLEGEALNEALELAWGGILKRGGVDLLRLRHVREDANITPFLDKWFHQAGAEDGAPWMDLGQFADEAAYERRYTKNQRRRRKRIRKALEKDLGERLDFSLIGTGEELADAIGMLVAEKRAWLCEKGLYSRPLGSPEITRFLRALPAGADARGLRLVVSEMRAGGRGVSWELGFRYKGRHYGYITAHDRELTDASPGRLHMDLSQRRALKDGMRVFDLLVPAAPHKKTWSSDVTGVRDYYRPVSLLGRALGDGYLRLGRPLLRRLYKKMPENLRRRLGLARLGGGGIQQ